MTIDSCTFSKIYSEDLYFTVVPSTNSSYTLTLSFPTINPKVLTPTTSPWLNAPLFDTLASNVINYYNFTVTNTTTQLLNITINNVQGGSVAFSYSTSQYPFIDCEAGSNCVANTPNCCTDVSTSCQLVVQPCNIQLFYYVAVEALSFSSSSYPITYEIQVSNTEFGSVSQLSNSIFVSGSLSQAHYDQYIFDDNGYKIDDETTLSVHLYIDQSNSAIENLNTTLFVNYNDVAGSGLGSSCWDSYLSCTITNVGSCTIQLNPCILNDYDDWYVSVYTGYSNNFYGRGVSYTILADLVEPVELEDPYLVINSVLYTNTFDHYTVDSDLLPSNGGFNLVVFNVLGGNLNVYLNYGGLAGPLDTCPSCFNNTDSKVATPAQPLYFPVTNCGDSDKDSDEVYFSVYSQNLASVSYSLTVEEIKNYKPNSNVKSGTPYVASIGPQSSLNYTIPASSSDSYLLVSVTQIDGISSPLSIKLYNATSLSCVDSESLIGSETVARVNQYASIVIPECEYNFGDGYLLVVENNSPNTINYNVYYETPSSTPNDLGNNVAYSDLVSSNGREFFTYSPNGEDTLLIEVYFDVCKDINGEDCVGTLSLTTIDPDTDTGCIPSESIDFQTSDTKSCVFVRTTCNETSGDLYMIVSTTSVLYPDAPLGYTILVSEFNSSVPTQPGKPMNMNIYPNQRVYHTFSYTNSTTNYLPTVNLRLSNQQNGTVSAVLAQTPPPNAEANCPCYDYSSLTTVEYCNAQSGEWSALVQASAATPNQLVGYTISIQELNSTLIVLTPQALSAQGSLSPLQYAFFDVRSIDWSLSTVISVVPTGGAVAVYTTTGPNPGTSQCGPRTVFCAFSPSACTQQLSACNSASGNPTFISVQGVAATSFDPIGFSITISQQLPIPLVTNQESALQQIPANVFYEYNYQLPVTFTAPLVGIAINNISVSTGFSVKVYNELGCFNEVLASKTCNATLSTCNLEVSSCELMQNSTLYIIIQATGSPLNFTIIPSFVDLVPNGGNIGINAPTSLVVNPNSYTVFTTTITNAAPQYSLSYLITSNTTLNSLHAYANWNTVTPDCSIWDSRFTSGSVTNTFSSCCVQPGTFSVLVFSPVYANLTIVFTQVQRLTSTIANPPVNTTTAYAISPQQTQEFSITLNPTSYYDFFYVTVSANASSNFYFQHAGLAGPSNGVRACYANSFSCTGDLYCVYKVPQCAFSTGLVDPYVAGTLSFGVQNLQNQPNTPLELNINYGTLNYVTLTDSTPAPVTVDPYLAAYGVFPLASNSVNQSVVINVDSPVTPFSFNIYNSDCTTNPPIFQLVCPTSPCNRSISTCGGVSEILVEVLNPSDTPFAASITAIITSTFVPSPLSLTPIPRTNVSTEYFSYEITVGSSTEYGQLVISDYTANQNQLTINWGITDIPVCFQPISDIIWTDNSDGTSTANVILNSCLLTSGTYVFELVSSVVANYSIAFDPLQQGNVTQISAAQNTRVAGEIRTNQRMLYNLTIDPNTVKPGQSLEITIENKCGESALYISQGTYAGPECGGIPILPGSSATLSTCDLLTTPLAAQGDNALYLTVIGNSQDNSQYDIPAQFLINIDISGEPVEFVSVGLDEVVSNSNNGNTIYVFAVSGVDSFVGQIQIAINELENGGVTDLLVSLSESTLCEYDFILSNIDDGETSYFINSCQANDARLIYLQFSGNNTESKFQISHTRPFIRDLDVFDEQPQNGAVVPSVNSVNSFMDEEYYSISLTSKEIENFLFTAWVANDDDDDSLAQQQALIQLTASQTSPPSLCVNATANPDYHSATFGNKLSWEWCEVDMEAPMYLTVNYPSSSKGTEAYPYSLFWSFGLDDEDVTILEPNTPSCDLVEGGETNHYVFQLPASTNTSIYSVEVYAINADTNSCTTSLDVSVAYGGLASSRCNLGAGFTQTCSAPCGSQSSTCSFSLNCPIEDWDASNTNISVSVYAPGKNDVSYFIKFFDTPTNEVALNITNGPILAGGDSSSTYYFTLTVPTFDPTSVLVLDVEPINGNSTTNVWFAYGHIPTSSCYDGTCDETNGCQIIIDACSALSSNLIIAVSSEAQFYISASVSTLVDTPIDLNVYAENNFASSLPLGSMYTYSLNITNTNINNTLFGELAVLVYGVNQGTITAWISYGTIGNPTNCYLDKQVIAAAPNQAPLPVVLAIDTCSFTTGVYYISFQLTARLDACSSVNFGLIPSIGTSDVTETILTAGTTIDSPILVGTTTTDFFTYDPASKPEILYLLIDVPENILYQVQFWVSPYGSNSVVNGPSSCASTETRSGATSYYWWGCVAEDSVRFQVTISTPSNLSVLPGGSYSVTANSLSSVQLGASAISAEIDAFYQVERFYTFVADTSNSFVIDIELTQGPSIEVAVYGTNCTEGQNTLVTALTCYYGPCPIPIDWSTTGFTNDTQYYVVISGSAPAKYSISLLAGEAETCVEATNTTLCTMVDWNVWNYGTGEAGFEQQNTASIVLYNDLVARFCPPCECVELSSSCNDSLIEFACTQTYRACDTTGLQASICQDSCEDIEENCGYTFEEVGLPQYSCNHNFYYTDSDGNDVCDDIYGINDTSGDKLLWLIVLIVVALILIVLIAVGAFIFYKKYQQAKRTGNYEAIQDANESDSSSSSINSTE